jgi:hypothetical protein
MVGALRAPSRCPQYFCGDSPHPRPQNPRVGRMAPHGSGVVSVLWRGRGGVVVPPEGRPRNPRCRASLGGVWVSSSGKGRDVSLYLPRVSPGTALCGARGASRKWGGVCLLERTGWCRCVARGRRLGTSRCPGSVLSRRLGRVRERRLGGGGCPPIGRILKFPVLLPGTMARVGSTPAEAVWCTSPGMRNPRRLSRPRRLEA